MPLKRATTKFLRGMEDQYPGEKPSRPERKYCKAFYLRDLRRYAGWTESRINWKAKDDSNKRDERADPGNDSAFNPCWRRSGCSRLVKTCAAPSRPLLSDRRPALLQSSLWPWQSGRTPRSSASFENH